MQDTINGLQQQHNALDNVENTMQRAELQLKTRWPTWAPSTRKPCW
ncbi:MAG: hypothetical protein M5U34_20265 [Chloroflexi bacterium]|nr:hypothetical protein [Chloroflexota bacterium]